MEDHTINHGLNLALGFSNVVVNAQPSDPDAVKSDRDNTGSLWPLQVPLQKTEREDPGYPALHSTGHDVNTSADFRQLTSEEVVPTMSEDELIIMYSDEESRELAKRKRMEQTGESGSMAVASASQERPSSSAGTRGDLLEKENRGDNGLPSSVTMVDNFIASDGDGTSDASNKKRLGVSSDLTETHTHSPSAALSDELRSVDEIEVVEEGFDDFEEGEVIKEFAQSRHGTNSETFLSQMHFFGGRTWARGRGRRGRGWGRDITNIALKLIETDQTETDGEHSKSVGEVDQIMTVTNGVRSGRGKFSDQRSSPSLLLRKSEKVPSESRLADISSALIEAELPSISSSASRKEAARGRGRLAGSKGLKAKQSLAKRISRTLSTTVNVDIVDYESNDEDTLAAIRASLEEMNKNNNTVNNNSAKDESTKTEDPEKEDTTKKSNSLKKADSLKKDNKTHKNAGSSKKDDKATESETLMRTGKEKKANSTKKIDNPKNIESNKKSDDQMEVNKTAGNKGKGQNTAKTSRGRPLINAKQAKETSNIEPEEELMYESNDEDTQAAIQASLEELEKEKQRKKERELEQQKTGKKQKKTGKLSKQKKSPSPTQSPVTEDSSPESVGKNSSASAVTRNFGFQSKAKPKAFRRERHSSRLSLNPEPSTSGYTPLSVEKQASSPGSQDSHASHQTQQKVENISVKLKNRIKSSVDHEGKKKGQSSDISDFDNVVEHFLQVEESPDSSISISSSISHKGERKRAMRKRGLNDSTSSSVDINVESDGERMISNFHAIPTNDLFLLDSTPLVQLQKLEPVREHAPSRCSSRAASSAFRKRVHDVSDGDHAIAFSRNKVAKNPSFDHDHDSVHCAENTIADKMKAGSSQYSDHGKSVTAITSSLDTAGLPSSEGKGDTDSLTKSVGGSDSLTKSVGGMMSYLFGDKLAEECPNGFVVNVRLEVEKKKEDDDDRGDNMPDHSGMCCKTRKPELCPCLQKVPDAKLASVLKERVEKRRDLTLSAKGSLLAAILNFMQELDAASAPH